MSQSETPELRAQMELLPEESPRGDSNLGNFEKSQNSNRGGALPHYLQTFMYPRTFTSSDCQINCAVIGCFKSPEADGLSQRFYEL